MAHPPEDCLPVELTRDAFQVLGRDGAFSAQLGELLSYNEYQGTGNFRITLTNLFNEYYPKSTIYGSNVMILPGASFAIHFICSHLKEKKEGGQVVIVEDPSYSLVYDIFYNLGLEIKGIPVDHEGLNVHLLEEELKSGLKIKFVYSIPVFHNPTGVSLSQQRRTKLIELSKEYNFYIISDEVYSLLSFQSPLVLFLT
uniref:Aminotransferase class I/classII large domain-containing protein n=1 Tax=Arcella intermedia TaxID=1963864 RepID=A0A6B2LIR6_9EUKA